MSQNSHPELKNSGEARSAILKAAEKLFAQKGLSGVSVKEISQAAGTNTALLFYYFNNKEQLYRSLILEAGDFIAEGFSALGRERKNSLDKLTEAVRFFQKTLCGNPNLMRLAVREMYGFGVLSRQELLEMQQTIIAPFEQIIRQGIEEGIFRAVDPKFTAIALLGHIHFFFRPDLICEQLDRETMLDNLLDIFLQGVLQK